MLDRALRCFEVIMQRRSLHTNTQVGPELVRLPGGAPDAYATLYVGLTAQRFSVSS